MGFLKKLIDSEYKELKKFERIADQIVALDEEMQNLSDKDLKNKTKEFKEQLANGCDLNELIIPAFAGSRSCKSYNWRKTILCSNIRWTCNSFWKYC